MGGTASPGEVLWTWQTSDIVLGICSVGATLIYLDFMLIPLTMAYFTTFTMLPVLEALEKRPYLGLCEEKAPWSKMMPVVDEEKTNDPDNLKDGKPKQTFYLIDEETRNVVLEKKSNAGDDAFFAMEMNEDGSPVLDKDGKPVRQTDENGKDVLADGAWIKECAMLGKVPHGIACLLTLFISFGILAVLLGIVLSNFSAFAANEEAKAAEGQPTISDDMCRLGNDIIAQLERDGVKILRPRTCTARNMNTTQVWSDIQDTRTVSSELFDGDDMVNDDDECYPMVINDRPLAVRRYSKKTFKCEQDWVQVAVEAGPWCGMDMLTVAAVDAGLDLSLDASDLRLFYECVDQMIGANTERTTDTDPFMSQLPPLRQQDVPSALDKSMLTGDVDPMNSITGCDTNSSIPFGTCVDSVRTVFIRQLAGLNMVKKQQQSLSDTRSCSGFTNDMDFAGVCSELQTTADPACPALMDEHVDSIETTCQQKDTKDACDLDARCRYLEAGTVDGTVISEGCTISSAMANADFGDLTVEEFCPTKCQLTGDELNDACTNQLDWAEQLYLGALDDLRMPKPPVDYRLGIKIENFYDEIMDMPLENCTSIDLFCSPNLLDEYGQEMVGTPWGELVETVGAVGALVSDVVLVLLLAVYILMERPMEEPEHRVVLEIEAMIKNYINLKILLSAITGVFVASFLSFCGVQLAMVFGLLAFMLNFVPCVGSLIATLLPIPLIILDDGLSESEKLVAFLGPTSVQLYVGNVLEPGLFGKSLNMTEIAVLNALVLAQLVWGLCGAVLSVPMLGIMKIVCHHTDHPVAKYTLAMVRADPMYP